jgi:hypothetical protein
VSAIKPREVRQNRVTKPGLSIVQRAEVEVIVPALPEELKRALPQTEEKWLAYWQSPVAQIALESGGLDLAGLHRWIINVEEWHRAMRAFRAKRIVDGSMGQPTLNPLGAYIASREAAIKDAEQQYGMTPMARLKLGIAVGQAKLTAQELNRALEDNGNGDNRGADDLDAEWDTG